MEERTKECGQVVKGGEVENEQEGCCSGDCSGNRPGCLATSHDRNRT